MKPTFIPAPGAVLRVATFPVESLEALEAPQLAELACAVDLDDAQAFAQFERAHAEELARTRPALWAATVEDARFRAALALSSPSLVRTLGKKMPEGPRNKRVRHRETSLYRYLSRACTRTEPQGLWCSVLVAPLTAESEARVEPAAPIVSIAPELAPFRRLLLQLAGREPYASHGPFRVNPTLYKAEDGRYRYLARDQQTGVCSERTLDHAAIGALFLRHLRGHGGALARFVEAALPAVGKVAAQALMAWARDAGLLIGGLRFPARFDTPFHALMQLSEQLEPQHGVLFAQCCQRLRAVCNDLSLALAAVFEPTHDTRSDVVQQIFLADEQARSALVELAQALDLPPPSSSDSMLRCDLGAPFRVTLGLPQRAELEVLLDQWAALERSYAASVRQVARSERVLSRCGPDGELFASVRPVLQDTQRAPGTDAGPPLGALILRPTSHDWSVARVLGLSQVATASHARHAAHLAQRPDVLLPWFRARFRALSAESGAAFVDLAHEHVPSPNVVARPDYVAEVLDPWSGREGRLAHDTRLVRGHAAGSLFAERNGTQFCAFAFSASSSTEHDPVAAQLLATSFDPRASGASVDATDEVERCHALPSGAVLLARREVLAPTEVAELVRARGATRYALFCRRLKARGLSGRVRLFRQNAPGLCVVCSSPLAVEAALEGLAAHEIVSLETIPEQPWLVGPEGRHMVELVLPVERTHHLLTRRHDRSEEHHGG